MISFANGFYSGPPVTRSFFFSFTRAAARRWRCWRSGQTWLPPVLFLRACARPIPRQKAYHPACVSGCRKRPESFLVIIFSESPCQGEYAPKLESRQFRLPQRRGRFAPTGARNLPQAQRERFIPAKHIDAIGAIPLSSAARLTDIFYCERIR